jgi:hypothetical protein
MSCSLRPISEAFDDDASGFITISEMNQFTEFTTSRMEVSHTLKLSGCRLMSRSLPHWIAFWAVGELCSSYDQSAL